MEKFLYERLENKTPKINLWFAYPAIESFAMASLGYLTIFQMFDSDPELYTERVYTDSKTTNINPDFVDAVSHFEELNDRGFFEIRADMEGAEKKAVILLPDGTRQEIAPGHPVRYTIPIGSRFVATDCHVICREEDEARVYEICEDERTQYGFLNIDGRISN